MVLPSEKVTGLLFIQGKCIVNTRPDFKPNSLPLFLHHFYPGRGVQVRVHKNILLLGPGLTPGLTPGLALQAEMRTVFCYRL